MVLSCLRLVRGGKPSGFTLIELIIVIVLIGILAAVAIPTYLGYQDSLYLRTALSQVEADLRNAQQKAKATGHHYEVMMIPGQALYRIYEHPIDGLASLKETKNLPGGVTIYTNTAPEANKIIYYPAAAKTETDGGTITLRSRRGAFGKLVIATITGRIRVE